MIKVDKYSNKQRYLSENVRYLRNKKRMTVRKFAEYVGLNYSTIESIENGLTEEPSMITIITIAKASDIKVEDLLYKDLKGGDEIE